MAPLLRDCIARRVLLISPNMLSTELTPVLEFAARNPAMVAVLAAIVVRAALAWQRQLTWPEYRTLHGIKRLIFPVLSERQPFGYGHWVHEKGGRDDAEYVATIDDSLRSVVRRLQAGGGSLHLINSIKRRPTEHGDPLSAAHVVWVHGETQTEAYLFRGVDGGTDVYGHLEPSVMTPRKHLDGEQTDGDPRQVIGPAVGV